MTLPIKVLMSLVCIISLAHTNKAAALCTANERVFPVCDINSPTAEERTTVIYAYSGEGLSSVSLGGDKVVTEVVDVEISAAEKPHYIVLFHGKALIWRFSGRIDTISRIAVLGSQLEGANHVGVIGVPKNKIQFITPDIDALKKFQIYWCTSLYVACESSAYFDIPKADRMKLVGPEPAHRHAVDQFVEHFRAGIIKIPEDGWVEEEERGRFILDEQGWAGMSGPARGRYEPGRSDDETQTSQTYKRGLIKIDASSVVSPESVADYSTLPAFENLERP